ncbi:MAG: (d)CMP kinase [Thermosulfidibacteraceae bacterium]|jgi:cytidylate kinase
MIVTIDGPAGSGKSTVARIIAVRYNFVYLDTGAIYRALGYLAKKRKINVYNENEVVKIIPYLDITLTSGENPRVFLSGEDITLVIRTEEIGMLASTVSKYKTVREKLLDLQRSFREKGDVIAEGRDTGTVVFPDADIKVFLTASVEERAKRRWKELREKRVNAEFEEILESLIKRDLQDSSREVAPLIPAKDALVIDTTNMTIEEVVEKIGSMIDGKRSL